MINWFKGFCIIICICNKGIQACVRLRVFLSKVPFDHESLVWFTFLYLSSPNLIGNDQILCFLTIKYHLSNTLSHVCFGKCREAEKSHTLGTPWCVNIYFVKNNYNIKWLWFYFEPYKILDRLDQRDSESPQDLSRDALVEKESFNEEDSKSEDPSSPPTTPRPGPSPLISFSPNKNNNPLQQMVTITNSLTALPPPPLGSPTSPMSFRNNGSRSQQKMALPPISQEQFDKYSHINTELLVRKVSRGNPHLRQNVWSTWFFVLGPTLMHGVLGTSPEHLNVLCLHHSGLCNSKSCVPIILA